MRIPGFKTAKLVSRRWLGRLRRGAVILGYHRISADPWDPFDLGVHPQRFREQVEVLVDRARPAGLARVVADRAARRSERARSVALTFDDAYAGCLSEVAPVLESFGVPATVFAISGSLGEEPWWERLARLLHPEVDLTGVEDLVPERNQVDSGDREQLTVQVHRRLGGLAPERREAELDRLAASLGIEDSGPAHRCLTGEELRRLTNGGLVEVGAHGHLHRELGRLSEAEQRVEVETSKEVLEEILGEPARGFSYPHGSFDASTPRLVEQAGFAYGCCSLPSAVLAGSDPFALPRVWVPDIGGKSFERWLTGWLGR